jgi:hypothetical protein
MLEWEKIYSQLSDNYKKKSFFCLGQKGIYISSVTNNKANIHT